MNIWHRATTAALALTALALVAIVGKLATDVYGGPLDPPEPPASTTSLIEPRTAIAQPASAAEFPIVINQPGSYYLASNITGVAAKSGIHIATGNVTLDLNGFHLSGVPGSATGIFFDGGSNQNVTIHNGVVQGWANGIDTSLVQSGRYYDLQILNNSNDGLQASSASFVRDVVIVGNSGDGILLAAGSSGALVINSTIENSPTSVVVNGLNVVMRDVNISGGSQVISHGGTGLWIGRNQVRLGNFAIVLDGSTGVVTRNTFIQSGSFLGIGTNNHLGSFAAIGTGTVSSTDVWSNVDY